MRYNLPAKSPVHNTYTRLYVPSAVSPPRRFECLGSVTVPGGAVLVEAAASHVLDRLKENATVSRCCDVNVVRASAVEVLDEGVPIHYLDGGDSLAFISTLAQLLAGNLIGKPYAKVIRGPAPAL